MYVNSSRHLPCLASPFLLPLRLSDRPEPEPGWSCRLDTNLLAMALLKSFGILVGEREAAPRAKIERNMPRSGDRRDRDVIAVIGKPKAASETNAETAATTHPSPMPEARYAYYRRCQLFRRNSEQCKAPAMKGEAICYRHAEQAEAERRRARQRREFLARPGVGFGSFKVIQRTISELARAILADAIDRKVAARLMMDIQTAIRLLRTFTTEARRPQRLNHRGHRGALRDEERRSIVIRANVGQNQESCHCKEKSCSAVTRRMRSRQTPPTAITRHRDIRLKPRRFSCRGRQLLNHRGHKGALRNEECRSIVVRANRYLGHARLFKSRGGIG